jgi:hypothetical protein
MRLAGLLGLGLPSGEAKAAEIPQTKAPPPPVPKAQSDLVEAFQQAIPQYDAAATPAAKKAIAAALDSKVQDILGPTKRVEKWVGTPVAVDQTPEGDKWISFDIGPSLLLGTLDSRKADAGRNTLVKKGTPLYDKLYALGAGRTVVFTATVLGYNNKSEDGRVAAPYFIARFEDLEVMPR